MKLSGREAAAFCGQPAPEFVGALLHGADAALVAARRRRLVEAVLGGETDDLRLTRLDAGQARRDPAAIDEALRSRGFFAGRQVVLIEGGTDGLTKPLSAALEGITPEDAFLVVTADALPARSALRKLFESEGRLASLAFYPEAPTPGEIGPALTALGLGAGVTREAEMALAAIGADMDHGSFRQLLEVVALSGLDRQGPLGEAQILALAPRGLEAEIDRFVEAVAGGEPTALGGLLRRLRAGGATPVALLIALQRHFRMLLTAASAAGGGVAGLARVRPPLWGRRRDMASAQLRRWGPARLEQASRLLFETDARIRSAAAPPDFALVERAALRLAILAQRAG